MAAHNQSVPSGLFYSDNVLPANLLENVWIWLNSISEQFSPITSSANSRKVYHLGYVYDYNRGATSQQADPFPDIIRKLLLVVDESLRALGTDAYSMNQCIINKYLPGQGISAHVDDKKFGPVIVCFTITQGPGRTLVFEHGQTKFELYTYPNSTYIMSGESRYTWKHSMPSRQTDVFQNNKWKRDVVYSITFRSLKV